MLASEIIDKFGGQSALAKLLYKRQSTIQHWYNNRIPAKWQGILLDLAKRQGIRLKTEDFFSDPTIPEAEYTGNLMIGDFNIPCAVLNDGSRILRERSVARVLGKKGSGAYWQKKRQTEKGAVLPEYISTKNLLKFIDNELEEKLLNPIVYQTKSGTMAQGLPALLLPEICNVWLKARDKGALYKSQENAAKKAEILIRGLANVGIIALVDEATGYQEIRDRIALQKILDKYLTDEWAKWTKTFPDDYYKELFRLNGMPYPPTTTKRPSYIGHWTNDIIYSRLVPGVAKELKRKNPRLPSGHRRRKHFQYLTQDIGHPALKEHLSNIIFLMKTCNDNGWDEFKLRLDLAKPKYGDNLRFPFQNRKKESE